ncbi:hypothetical protein MCAP1_002023 [Malassezia caprae]|uniref:Pentafunctional AROM polypeptide n=1 Tax=Malassezia caprae TaxID=1381934 RepID=A0AAF0EBV2_9BASI|nr:hypothetical protein MCAP1_002023 [Malassezia caprae]
MNEAGGGHKVPSYHAPPFTSTLSGATIHELRCLDTRIQLGYHLVPHIVQTLYAELPTSSYVLFTDTNLEALGVVDKFREAFETYRPEGNTSRVLSHVLPPGEESKSRETKAGIEDWMLEHRLTRDTVVLACGGGVIGDLVGFVSATFMRGLKYVQIPTTLLAMVDSAVGGKTAIDHPHGKNLIGAFHQPYFVFVDAAWLLTLPEREFSNGMAEVVKTAAIWDASDFDKLESESESIRAAVLSSAARAAPAGLGHTLGNRTPSQTLLLDVIRGSIGVKAHIVTIDEKETGLRNLVNFGHSVGHAIEAVLTPAILHGECVAMGMVLEAEIARVMHGLPQVAIGRLVRALSNYGLPVSLKDARIAALPQAQAITTARLLDIMRVDKKNAGTAKKIVLLSRIGATVEERASTVPDAVIARVLAPSVQVHTSPGTRAPVTLPTPGSKSVSNRALVLAALAQGTCRLRNLLHSDDTQVMMNALRTLGAADFAWEEDGAQLVVHGGGGRLEACDKPVYLQNAGTAARFMTGVTTLLREGAVTLTGNARMKQRPIGPLVEALCANGADIACVEAQGALPLRITGRGGLRGGAIRLAADVSSQYVSAVLLCAPYAQEAVTLELVGGKVISQPYIDMTVAMMASFGVHVERVAEHVYRIPQQIYRAPAVYTVESDASSATYPLAVAAITGTTVTVPSIGSASLQGDARFARDILAPMGCHVEQTESSTTVTGPPRGTLRQLGEVDMEPMTDAFMTAAVLFAVAQGASTKITGIANQRVKECDRLRATVTELAKFGVQAHEHDDGIVVYGRAVTELAASAPVACYDDHRIAMAFSVLASVVPGAPTTLEEKRCVEKTWPTWWDVLSTQLQVPLAAADEDVPLVPAPRTAALPGLPARYDSDATIVLIGMRASGKSHIGRLLAERMQRTFVDADEVLSQRFDLGTFIAQHGWDAFREEETRVLEQLLHECARDHVLALGGGVVESAASRALLTAFQRTGPVVHVVRRFEEIEAFLATSHRPPYGEPLRDVYERRQPWYDACACLETVNDGDVVTALVRQLASPLGARVPARPAFFLSLTFPHVRDALPVLAPASAGVDVLELRVDLLHPKGTPSVDEVREQVVLLRQHSPLPILYTVRSASEGGRFPDDQEHAYWALVRLGVRLGCEWVDVELRRSAEAWRALREGRGAARIVASAHDTKGSVPWTSAAMAQLYERGRARGDLVKLVGVARTVQDNVALEAFRAAHDASVLIAINMQAAGQLSRVLNPLLTPVTHPSLPSKAAPGQLSVREIHAARHLLGLLPARRFALLGSPIAHSLSPLIHNTAFELLGLPHTYALHETATVEASVHALLRAPDFGGASVTIPHKVDILPLLDKLSPEAQAIGAVNTVVPHRDGERLTLHGENTDWRAIYELAQRARPAARVALVIGAGGSARAALYAMHRLGAASILLYNRTYARAAELAASVPAEWRVQPLPALADAVAHGPDVIVSNVPAAGTSLSPGSADIVLPADLLSPAGGVAIDMAYRPEKTPLLTLVEQNPAWHGVRGLEILLEQAFHQFRLWTGLPAPHGEVARAAWHAYHAQAQDST